MLTTTTQPRPTLTPPPFSTFEMGRNVSDKTESTWNAEGDAGYSAHVTVNYDPDLSLAVTFAINPALKGKLQQRHFRAIAESVCAAHPGIDINDRVKGIPIIKGNRISVGQLLGRIYALGSIDAVVEFYRSAISKEQVKEAVAFAQDFLEAACEPI